MSADLFADWQQEQQQYGSSSSSSRERKRGSSRNESSRNRSVADDYYEEEYDDDESENQGRMEEEQPMFELKEHHLKMSRRKGFTLKSMGIGNGIMAMGSHEGSVLRCTIDSRENDVEEIPIEARISVYNVFIDPSGAHILVSMENGNNYYINAASNRPKKLVKAQGLRFSCVAWDRQKGSPNSTQLILIGTDSGSVYEAIFDGKEKHFRKAFQNSNSAPIASIEFEQWTNSKGEARYFVMLSISGTGRRPTRLFEFTGGPTFEALFGRYVSTEKLRFQELPGEIDLAWIRFYSKRERERAKSFGCLTGEGVYHGNLVFGASHDNIVTGADLLPFPSSTSRKKVGRNVSSTPLSFDITAFHVILLYQKKVLVVNKLSKVVVLDASFDSRVGNVEGLAHDLTLNSIWIYSDRRINQVVVVDEDRDMWKLLVQKARIGDPKDFEVALSMCKTESDEQQVFTAQADYYFEREQYDRAAAIYAKTTRSFEEVALRLVDVGQRDCLKTFLLEKLKCLKRNEKTQKTVVCTWLVELYLDQFTYLDPADVDDHANLLFEFKQFLQDHKRSLDPATTFNLIASHGRSDELVYYANLIQDYEKVVAYNMQRGDYNAAVDILRSAPASKVKDLYYKFSPELIQHSPRELLEAWKSADGLEASKLIPAIVRYSRRQSGKSRRTDLAIDYLSHAVKQGDRNPTIHNYLLFLYAHHPDERQLIKFLRRKHGGKHLFDVTYALRLCTQQEKNRACIYIYSAMGLYLEAVDKALQVDVKIAKEIASQPEDVELQKQLWTLIAKHTIDVDGDVREAMSILKESKLLKIEDILLFFPDFTIINDFKKEIVTSLESYNDRIEELKAEMRDYTESAELIRSDMKTIRKRVTFISGNQRCDLTGENILEKEFYVFPCGHAFHAAALRLEMQKHLNSFQRENVKQLIQKLNSLPPDEPLHQKKQSTNETDQPSAVSERELVQSKLDSIVASECIYCGEVMIKTITMPFITQDDEEREGADWKF